ncbi:amino acid permease [Candidatus Woesearchaeota archaeon]|nr:amino acid permease [Candidatus Woesearchaeota archaeon]
MPELKKVLSYKVLLLIVISSIMGTGIFFLPATGAKIAGPASLISWAILSLIAVYIAACFAELCSMFPSAGGVYEFCKQAYSKELSFIIGWLTLIAGNITIAMLIIGAISYLLPAQLPQLKPIIMVISASFILLFNIVAYRGMKISATMLVTFSFITIATLAALGIPSALGFNSANLTPFFPYKPAFAFLAVFFIAETFFGWESPTFLAGETKNGQEVVPKAIFHGTIIICIISFFFVLFSIGAVGWQAFGASSAPLATLAEFNFGNLGRQVFMILVYLAIIGSVAAWVVSAPRLILTMSKDRFFLSQFAKIHPKFNTPYKAIIFQSVLSITFIFLGLGSYNTLLHLLVPLLLVMYSFVLIALVVLRYKKPGLKRYFRAPFGKSGPIIIVILFTALLITWLVMTEHAVSILLRGATLILLGIPIYLLLQMYYNPRAVRIIDDILAYFTLLTERIALPLKVRKEIIHLLGDIKGKIVLEFGCSVGTLTLHLAEEVGPKGQIWATNISKREVNIAQKRAVKKGHNHVVIIHDEKHAYRVHPSIPKINTIVSVGMLGYLQDIETVLRQINKRLEKGSKICFLDYDKFFDIIPNADWLSSDSRIKRIFKKCGFSVSVLRKQGFAWKYIYIYGVKERNIK